MSRSPRPTTRRAWGTDDTGCVILHVDMDSFFASVELLDAPELRGRAVIVGGRERGVVTSATYEARAYGVHAAMPIGRARRLCPHATFLPGRHQRYREVSRQVMDVVRSLTDTVESISIDEAFLDVSGARRRLGSPVQIATLLRQRVRDEVGVPASVGIASTKHVAKLATTYAKPDGMLLVAHDQTIPFLHHLPVGALWGVGEKTRATLMAHGVRTVEALAHTPVESLARWIGTSAAQHLYALAWGRDARAVEPTRVEKSVGTETTFGQDVSDRLELERVMLGQAHECAVRLRAEGYETARVAIKVRFSDFHTLSRSRAIVPTQTGAVIAEVARELLRSVSLGSRSVRLVGVRAEGLVNAAETGFHDSLDGSEVRHRAELAMDEVTSRFGSGALAPGSLVRRHREGEVSH